MKELTISEIHEVLLNMAKEFDNVCQKHEIPYYMLGGTMLGAIRHKGFIPWDDDMDFGVPREYYKKLYDILNKELPKQYKCCSFENSSYVFYPYYKIEDRTTRLDSAQLGGSIEDKIGVNIDIFPLDACQKGEDAIKSVIRLNDIYGRIYTQSASKSIKKNLIKKIIRLIIPISQKKMYSIIENKIKRIPSGGYWANLFGHWEEKEIVPKGWYGERKYYTFESIKLCGIENYESYLTQLYGDYMKFPPEKNRIPHGDKAYKL